jgi:transcriptional regulator with XRE-family HTH domain
MNIGKRIKESREKLNVTQKDLAKSAGVTPQHISIIEQDKRAPSLPLLAKIADELGVTIDYIVTGKECVITDTIPAIKGDKRLSLQAKQALTTLVEILHGSDNNDID